MREIAILLSSISLFTGCSSDHSVVTVSFESNLVADHEINEFVRSLDSDARELCIESVKVGEHSVEILSSCKLYSEDILPYLSFEAWIQVAYIPK